MLIKEVALVGLACVLTNSVTTKSSVADANIDQAKNCSQKTEASYSEEIQALIQRTEDQNKKSNDGKPVVPQPCVACAVVLA